MMMKIGKFLVRVLKYVVSVNYTYEIIFPRNILTKKLSA